MQYCIILPKHDCKKSIPIMDKDGHCVLPHYLYSDYNDLIKSARFCSENKTLLDTLIYEKLYVSLNILLMKNIFLIYNQHLRI